MSGRSGEAAPPAPVASRRDGDGRSRLHGIVPVAVRHLALIAFAMLLILVILPGVLGAAGVPAVAGS